MSFGVSPVNYSDSDSETPKTGFLASRLISLAADEIKVVYCKCLFLEELAMIRDNFLQNRYFGLGYIVIAPIIVRFFGPRFYLRFLDIEGDRGLRRLCS